MSAIGNNGETVSVERLYEDLGEKERLFRELSAGVRKSETVALGYPIMPVAEGLGG